MKHITLALMLLLATPLLSEEITVNNRILTTVNGKTFSVLDVMKQMNVFLSEHYPEYLDSPQARMQFYMTQWRSTLQRMIDEELMLADAESREIKTTDAEVREEIQNRYGPNVRGSLDKLGLSYEEAKEMIHQELVVQKMQWFRVTSKVLSKVTTNVVRHAYTEYLQKNPPKEMWTYQFLTIRYNDLDTALSIAQQIKALYDSAEGNLTIAADLFKEKLPEAEWKQLAISAEFESQQKELSPAHLEVLQHTLPSHWSDPALQESRDGSKVVRIFHLKAHTKQETPAFETMATGLKQDVLNQNAETEMKIYLTRLHQRFGFDPKTLNIRFSIRTL